ncbi:hypothetical protein [Pseudarthrobacter sp. S9]|uniref:hypothetical protein n=1 Tax=Pseudarthrobacter sp. S9 TaxID=3418421 RepID=UPI003D0683A3
MKKPAEFGYFDVDESTATVVHPVEYASAPHMANQDLPRLCILDGDNLTLDSPPMSSNGEDLGSYIKWTRSWI